MDTSVEITQGPKPEKLSIEFQQYDPKRETLGEFLERVNDIMSQENKSAYSVVLSFINQLMGRNYKSLTQFTNVKHDWLTGRANTPTGLELIKANIPDLMLGLKIKTLTLGAKPDKTANIVKFLKDILKPINYSLNYRTVDGVKYYYIKLISS